MDCCNKCNDHLIIPKGAISEGEEYEITQSFPVLCSNYNFSSENWPICVKEYEEYNNRSFHIHVTIVAYFTKNLNPQQLRVRYSTPNDIYVYEDAVFLADNIQETLKPDVYFQVNGNKVMICT